MLSIQSNVGSNEIIDDKDLANQEEGMATQQELDEVKDNESGNFDKDVMNLELVFNRHSQLEPISPDLRPTSFVFTDEGSLQFSFTTGNIWKVHSEFIIPAFNLTTSDTFTYVYRDGIGGHTQVASQTAIDNTMYDDGSGTLSTIPGASNRHVNHWVYVRTDGTVYVVYGQSNFTSGNLQLALDENLPTDIPSFLVDDAVPLFQITITENQSPFTNNQKVSNKGKSGPPGPPGSANGSPFMSRTLDTDTGTITTEQTIDFDVLVKESEVAPFTINGAGNLTVVTPEDYLFVVRLSIDSGNNTRAVVSIFLDLDTGSGFVEVPGTRAYVYSRQANDGEGTGVIANVLPDLKAGDIVRVRAEEVGSGGSPFGLASGSSLTAFAMKNKGDQGDPGLPGNGVYRQDYDNATTYDINDYVTHLGSLWISLQGSNLNNQPDSSPAFWHKVVCKGDPGEAVNTGFLSRYSDTDSTADIGTATPVTVLFEQQRTSSIVPPFSYSAGEFTCLVSDFYDIDINISSFLDAGAADSTLRNYVEINSGSGFVELISSAFYTNMASGTEDHCTANFHDQLFFNVGDQLRIRSIGVAGNNNRRLLAEGTRIAFKALRGKGDTGLGNGVFLGPWNSATTYSQNDSVQYLGSLFVSRINNNLNNTPDGVTPGDTTEWFLMVSKGQDGPAGPATLTPLEVSATNTVSIGATGYVLMPNMIHTNPPAGNYIVSFSASGREAASNNNDEQYAIFVGGSIVQHTERDMNFDNNAGARDIRKSMHTQCLASVNGSQNIEVRWNNSGGTFEAFERSLLIMRY